MPSQFETFDPAFAQSGPTRPLRRSKTGRQIITFLLANLIILPFLLMIHATIAGEGIARSLPVFQRKLWSLPIPGVAYAKNYQGFSSIDLSFISAVGLFLIATMAWKKLFLMLSEGSSGHRDYENPSLSLIHLGVSLCIIIADAVLFWAGLATQSASGWSDTPFYVAPLATVLFSAITAAVAAWHADFHTSRYS